jgi:hypothetical protein
MRSPLRAGLFAGILTLFARAALAGVPVYYSTVWEGKGGRFKVEFAGTSSRGNLAGKVRVDGVPLVIKGIIATDGSVSGSVSNTDGVEISTFSGRPDASGALRGSFKHGDASIPWGVPMSVLPSATVD